MAIPTMVGAEEMTQGTAASSQGPISTGTPMDAGQKIQITPDSATFMHQVQNAFERVEHPKSPGRGQPGRFSEGIPRANEDGEAILRGHKTPDGNKTGCYWTHRDASRLLDWAFLGPLKRRRHAPQHTSLNKLTMNIVDSVSSPCSKHPGLGLL